MCTPGKILGSICYAAKEKDRKILFMTAFDIFLVCAFRWCGM